MVSFRTTRRRRPQFSVRTLGILVALTAVYFGAWDITRRCNDGSPLGGDCPMPLVVRRNVVSSLGPQPESLTSQYYLWLFGLDIKLPFTSDPASAKPLTELDWLKLKVAELRSRGERVRIDLSRQPLSRDVLTWLSQLPDLEILHLDHSGIDDDGLGVLSRSSSLRRLTLNHTATTDSGLEHLSRIETLEDLSLRGIGGSTPITDFGVAHLARLRRLWKLDLSANPRLTDATVAAIARLPRLRWLSLWRVPITGEGLQSMSRCTRLETLQVSGTRIDDDSLRHLASLSRLHTLGLPGPSHYVETLGDGRRVRRKAGVEGPGLTHLWHLPIEELQYPFHRQDISYWAGFTRLRTLGHHVEVRGEDLVHLQRMRSLERLVIKLDSWRDANLLTALRSMYGLTNVTIRGARAATTEAATSADHYVGLNVLQQLPRLERLELKGVTDEALIHLTECRCLRTLDLRFTDVAGTGLKHLRSLDQLRVLALDGRLLSDRGLRELSSLTAVRHLILGEGARPDDGILQYHRERQASAAAVSWSPVALGHFSRCRRLESLDLSGLPIGDEAAAQLVRMPNLRQLSLNGTLVGNAGVAVLHRLGTLRMLHLQRTGVGDEGILPLAQLPHLRMLDVIGTEVSPTAAAAIYKSRNQQCRITDNWCCGCMAFEPITRN